MKKILCLADLHIGETQLQKALTGEQTGHLLEIKALCPQDEFIVCWQAYNLKWSDISEISTLPRRWRAIW